MEIAEARSRTCQLVSIKLIVLLLSAGGPKLPKGKKTVALEVIYIEAGGDWVEKGIKSTN